MDSHDKELLDRELFDQDLLDRVNLPLDLRKLNLAELKLYAGTLRTFLINQMSETGGHVAANLGVVELTVALHYSFKTPDDKLIWDVGHQSYAHKVLTGRKKLFSTLRQEDGLSGFTRRSESEFDPFGAGHSSTAISAGLGIAEAEWQKKSSNFVISIVGDGALTAGMAFEGLNHAASLKRLNHIIVINDNEYSISENIGAIANFFSPTSVNTVPGASPLTSRAGEFFKLLGFNYVGPIDGHDLNAMTSTFKKIRAESEKFIIPTVIHVKTKKGLGLKSAEENPKDFHGVTGFSKSSGLPQKVSKSAPTYTDVFSQSLCRIAQKDPQVVAVTAAMTEGTGLSKFQKLFPQRFYDVGIAEQHAVTFAGALRLEGLKPAVAIYSTFLQRAYDQVIHDVALQKIPLALFLDRAGLVGADGPTHHGAFDLSFLRCVPNLVLMAPKDENELQHMVFTALNNGAFTAVRFPRGEGLGVTLDADFKMLKEGTSEKVFSESQNSEVCIWAVGSCVYPAIQAAQELALQGVNCEVVNARFIKPIDREALLKDAQSVKLLVSVEENSIVGGFGSAILEELSKSKLKTSTLQLGIPDNFIEHGSQSSQRQSCHIDSAGITQAVMKKIKHDQGK